MNRREVLKFSGAAVIGSALVSRLSYASEGPLTFGVPLPMSGVFAANGKFGAMGAQLYAESNKSLLGRPLSNLVIDTQAQPGTAVRKVQDAFDREAIRFFVGGTLSSSALAMGEAVNKLNGVFFTATGADEITGVNCNRSTFRWSVPTLGAVRQTIGPLLKQFPDAKRWYTITAQYLGGEAMLRAAKELINENNRELIGNSFHPLNESEFSGYITNALASKPDVLVFLNFGQQTSESLRTAVNFGAKQKCVVAVVWSSGLEQFQSLGADICEDVYFGAQYWHTIDSPGNRKLVEITKQKFGINPNYSLAQIYIMEKVISDAISKAGTTDVKAVISALEGMSYEGLTGTEVVRKEDHQVIKDYYLLKGKSKSAMNDKDDYCNIVDFGKSYLSPEEAGCKMS